MTNPDSGGGGGLDVPNLQIAGLNQNTVKLFRLAV